MCCGKEMDVQSALCYFIFLLFMPTCLGQLLHADILTQFFNADSKIRPAQNTRQKMRIKNGNQLKQTDIMKDYLDILLHNGHRKNKSFQRPPMRQKVSQDTGKSYLTQDTRNSYLKGHRQFAKIREIMSDGKLRGSTLTLFKKPHERQLHKISTQNVNMMSNFPGVKEHKSTLSRTNEILQAIWKHRGWKTESTVKTTIRPPTVSMTSRLPLQTTSGKLIKQKSVDVPPLPQASTNTSPINEVTKRIPLHFTTKGILMTALSTDPSTFTASSNDTSVSEQTTILLPLPTTTATWRPEQATVTLPLPTTSVTLRPEQTTLTLPLATTTVTLKTEQATVSLPLPTTTVTLRPEQTTFTLPLTTTTVTLKPEQTTDPLPLPITTVTLTPEQTITQGMKTQTPLTPSSTAKVKSLQPTQTVEPVELKPVDVIMEVTKASITKLKTSDSVSGKTTTGLPYSLSSFSDRITAAGSFTQSMERISSTTLKQTPTRKSPGHNTTIVTTPLIPMTMSSIHQSVKTENYVRNATEKHTITQDFRPRNDTVSPDVLSETKILVSDNTNPFFEKLKNPNFWNFLNIKQNKDKDTTTKANTVCSKECTIVQNVCKNGATCVNSCTGFTCICAQGFTGYFCEKVAKSEVTTEPVTTISPLTKP